MPSPCFTSPTAPLKPHTTAHHRPRRRPSTCPIARTTALRAPTNPPRRQVLRKLSLLPLSLLLPPFPTRADRTGKYSTKLTAKRRYLPRIARGLSTLSAAHASSVPPEEDAVQDLLAALRLFVTTYFSEGNRISPRERALNEHIDALETAVLRDEWGGVVRAVNAIVDDADLVVLAGVRKFEEGV